MERVIRVRWFIDDEEIDLSFEADLVEEGFSRACSKVSEGYNQGQLRYEYTDEHDNSQHVNGWWSLEEVKENA